MAERRMFSKSIIDSDLFLDMPMSARLLYYDLSMRADDDGFVDSPKKVMRITGATVQDLQMLIANKFIIPFEEKGIVVIRHWRIHNYIRTDRYTPTVYAEEKASLTLDGNKMYIVGADEMPMLTSDSAVENANETERYTNGIPTVSKMDTQVRLGKDRLGKDRIDYQQIADMYNEICISFPRLTSLSEARKKAISARMNFYTVDQFRQMFTLAEQSAFLKGANDRNWRANFDWLMRDANFAKVLDGNYKKTEEKRTAIQDRHGTNSQPTPDIKYEV